MKEITANLWKLICCSLEDEECSHNGQVSQTKCPATVTNSTDDHSPDARFQRHTCTQERSCLLKRTRGRDESLVSYTKKLLEIKEFSKVKGHKMNIQKAAAFLNNE